MKYSTIQWIVFTIKIVQFQVGRRELESFPFSNSTKIAPHMDRCLLLLLAIHFYEQINMRSTYERKFARNFFSKYYYPFLFDFNPATSQDSLHCCSHSVPLSHSPHIHFQRTIKYSIQIRNLFQIPVLSKPRYFSLEFTISWFGELISSLIAVKNNK